jgi:hypothetical protein
MQDFPTRYLESDKLIAYADYFMQGKSSSGLGGVMLAHDFSLFQDEKTSLSGGLFTDGEMLLFLF